MRSFHGLLEAHPELLRDLLEGVPPQVTFRMEALEATNIQPSAKLNHKGKPFFIDNGRGMCPMLIKAGQIVEPNQLTTYTADITKDIFNTMTFIFVHF